MTKIRIIKVVQCEMANETNTDATESLDFPSDISSTDDESETSYREDAKSNSIILALKHIH